jgi:hypothetical protein
MELVNLFWDNTELGKLELSCLNSYLENNHLVNLFTYNKNIYIPRHNNLSVIDANEIIEKQDKFYYIGNGDCVKNSIVGFSDIFRYEVLYKAGGWYSDMDVINLKNLSDISPRSIVIRPHKKFNAVSNICKFPKAYEPLREVKQITLNLVNSTNDDWTLPLKLFYEFVVKNKLEKYILNAELTGNDDDIFIQHLLCDNLIETRKSIKNMYGIHWCKSAFSTGNWNSNAIYNFNFPKKMTLLHYFYYKYGINNIY